MKDELSKIQLTFAEIISQKNHINEELILDVGLDKLWEFSRIEESESIVGSKLIDILGKNALDRKWIKSVNQVESRLNLYMQQLDRVANELSSKGILLIALKNAGIARGIHKKLAECPMGDIDLLVKPSDFHRAHEILSDLGFELDDRSPFDISSLEEAEKHGGAEYKFVLSNGDTLWLELQWRPVAGRWIQPNQEPSADDLVNSSIPIQDSAARLLSPEDNLLQVCLHTAKHSYVRAPGFRLHTDVDRIVSAYEINWDLFCTKVEEMNVKTAVYLSLLIPKELLFTEIPGKVLNQLNHSPIKHRLIIKWLIRVGLFGPLDRKWSKVGYIIFNLALYDSFRGVLRAIFPNSLWMKKHYGLKYSWTLPFWHLVRIASLLFKRART
jgi:hypothetical protein